MVYPLRQPAYPASFFLVKISIVLLYQYYFPVPGYHYRSIHLENTRIAIRYFQNNSKCHYGYFTGGWYPATDLLFPIIAFAFFAGNNVWSLSFYCWHFLIG